MEEGSICHAHQQSHIDSQFSEKKTITLKSNRGFSHYDLLRKGQETEGTFLQLFERQREEMGRTAKLKPQGLQKAKEAEKVKWRRLGISATIQTL